MMRQTVDEPRKLSGGGRACVLLAISTATVLAVPAQTFTTLYSFNKQHGESPEAKMVQATDGDLYGTTYAGGPKQAGVLYKMTPDGALTTLYEFCAQAGCTDGEFPETPIEAANGDFYGTTSQGGAGVVGKHHHGYGTVFRMTPDGALTTLYTFCQQAGCLDGAYPGVLVQARSGDIYGTTGGGGASQSGTIFKITPSGALTTLYSFCAVSGCADGSAPVSLVQGADGDFYGVTIFGGANVGTDSPGTGTIFKITPDGSLTTLYVFCQNGCQDGAVPSDLVQDTKGDFYGTTQTGGANSYSSYCSNLGCGTVFKVTPGGVLTTLYSFCSQSNCTDGVDPIDGVIQATDGDFYGATAYGGASNLGTVFKLTRSGDLTTLHTFCPQTGCLNGESPFAGLVQATNGDFYGTTVGGGVHGRGTAFSLSVGLGPFVKTLTDAGEVGATVKILGTGLTGATNVTFNGTMASFRVVSSSEVSTSVPAGATTGTVLVVTPNGTLVSSAPFHVLP